MYRARRNRPAIEQYVDLDTDGSCEMIARPSSCLIGSGGRWYELFRTDPVRSLGTLSGLPYRWAAPRDGLLRIVMLLYEGHKTSPIFTLHVGYWDSTGYVSEFDGRGRSHGWYLDRGREAYEKGELAHAEAHYTNAYVMSLLAAGRQLSANPSSKLQQTLFNANNLALVYFKQERLDEAAALLRSHIDGPGSEQDRSAAVSIWT